MLSCTAGYINRQLYYTHEAAFLSEISGVIDSIDHYSNPTGNVWTFV